MIDVEVVGAKGKLAALEHGIPSVDGEVDDHLLELTAVEFDGPQFWIGGEVDADDFAEEALENDAEILKDRIGLDGAFLARVGTSEAQELASELAAAFGGDAQTLDAPGEAFRVVEGVLHDVAMTVDDGEEVVEVVGDAAGQASHGLHFVGMLEVFLNVLLFGLVGEDGKDKARGAVGLTEGDVGAEGKAGLAIFAQKLLMEVNIIAFISGEVVTNRCPDRMFAGVKKILKGSISEFIEAKVEHIAEGRVDMLEVALEVEDSHADGAVLKEGPETLFAVMEALFEITLAEGPFDLMAEKRCELFRGAAAEQVVVKPMAKSFVEEGDVLGAGEHQGWTSGAKLAEEFQEGEDLLVGLIGVEDGDVKAPYLLREGGSEMGGFQGRNFEGEFRESQLRALSECKHLDRARHLMLL